MKEKLLVIDSNSLLYRSFHALPALSIKKGEQTGAMYGFLLTLFKAIEDIRPDFIIACFDYPAPTFRHKKFKEYKSKRKETPKELIPQISKMKNILKEFNVLILEKKGFEADDLISTITKRINKKTYIMTGDTDLFQLINKKTSVYTLKKGIKDTIIYNEKEIFSRFSLFPNQMVDFKTLTGDPSDNIPGVPGIGKKTATNLLKEFKTLENIYKNSDKIKEKTKESLLENKKQVLLSKELIKTKENVPLKIKIENFRFKNFNPQKAENILKKFNFKSLVNRLPNLFKKSTRKQLSLI